MPIWEMTPAQTVLNHTWEHVCWHKRVKRVQEENHLQSTHHPLLKAVQGGREKQSVSVTWAAEKSSTPEHSEERGVRVSAVLAGEGFTQEKSELGEIETNPTCFTSKLWIWAAVTTAGGLLPPAVPEHGAASPAPLLPCSLTWIMDAFVLPGEENKPPRAQAWHLGKLSSSNLFDQGTCIIDAVCFTGLENPCN